MRSFIATLILTAAQASKYEKLNSHTLLNNLTNAGRTLTPIEITIDGVKTTKYIASDGCTGEGDHVTCPMNYRGFIMNSDTFMKSGQPDYWQNDLNYTTV